MSLNGSHQTLVIAVTVLVLSIASCTPSPKYRGKPRREEPEPTQTTKIPSKPPVQAHIAFTEPVSNLGSRKLTSLYGVRSDPRYKTKEFHHGIDIKAEAGEEVLASAPGTVIFAGKQSGFGNVIIIDHGKRFCTVSAHLSSMLVREGARVDRGDVIGKVGSSGNATGTHLHFELRIEGKSVDPLRYIEKGN
jgi:murein DD-endopeptidase MepM/ murein hydrolase activator NlpD